LNNTIIDKSDNFLAYSKTKANIYSDNNYNYTVSEKKVTP